MVSQVIFSNKRRSRPHHVKPWLMDFIPQMLGQKAGSCRIGEEENEHEKGDALTLTHPYAVFEELCFIVAHHALKTFWHLKGT